MSYYNSADNVDCARNSHGAARLSGGGVSSEGTVEVCLNGTWARVCAEVWTEDAARVVCRQFPSHRYRVMESNLKLS